MKAIKLFMLLFLVFAAANSRAQNDCVDAIVICGDANLSNLPTNGFGIQEIGDNACYSYENNTIWLKLKIRTGGTFGFILTPESNDLIVDFDFWIFGPNVNCGNIGNAIRCSTTNPLNAGLNYNITGMNDVEVDTSEGPGPNGNAFIQWMHVNDDDTYYIAIDRPIGESNFSIAWTGTATFYDAPNTEPVVPLHACKNSDTPEDTAFFNLAPNGRNAIGNQENVTASFYTTDSDAVTGQHAINNINAFENTSDPQKIFVRVTNTVTGCFAVTDFDLHVDENLPAIVQFTYETPVCIAGKNPVPVKVVGFTEGGFFSATPEGLSIDRETGIVDLSNSHPGKFAISYAFPDDACYKNAGIFELSIKNCMIPKGISPNGDGKNDIFDLEGFDVKSLTIFNRYGMKVYHKKNYVKEWNGLTDKGKTLPDATYYYLIEFENGEKKTGWVYVIREY